MLAVKLLLLVLVAENIANVNSKCTRVQLVVKAEYLESGLEKDSKYTRVASKSTSFERSYNNLDISATVSGSYGGFSGSASASFSQTSDFEQSRSESSDITKKTEVTYAKGQNHLVEKVTKTVTIDGQSKTVISREPKDFYLVKDSPTIKEMRKKGEDYIRYNFGGIPGGKIRKNVYSASACIKEQHCEDDEDGYKRVLRKLSAIASGFSAIYIPPEKQFKYSIRKYPWCSNFVNGAENEWCGNRENSLKNVCKKSCGQC